MLRLVCGRQLDFDRESRYTVHQMYTYTMSRPGHRWECHTEAHEGEQTVLKNTLGTRLWAKQSDEIWPCFVSLIFTQRSHSTTTHTDKPHSDVFLGLDGPDGSDGFDGLDWMDWIGGTGLDGLDWIDWMD